MLAVSLSTCVYRKVLQSAIMWVVNVECFRFVTVNVDALPELVVALHLFHEYAENDERNIIEMNSKK